MSTASVYYFHTALFVIFFIAPSHVIAGRDDVVIVSKTELKLHPDDLWGSVDLLARKDYGLRRFLVETLNDDQYYTPEYEYYETCEDYDNQGKCKKNGCAWDKNNKSCYAATDNCSVYIDRKTCKSFHDSFGCTWIPWGKSKGCHASTDIDCSSFNDSPHLCDWEAGVCYWKGGRQNGVCELKTERTKCSDFGFYWKCRAEGCIWSGMHHGGPKCIEAKKFEPECSALGSIWKCIQQFDYCRWEGEWTSGDCVERRMPL